MKKIGLLFLCIAMFFTIVVPAFAEEFVEIGDVIEEVSEEELTEELPEVEDEVELMATVDSGVCGDNLTWTLDGEGTLTISGTGDMMEWTSVSAVPWNDCRVDIVKVIIEHGATTIGNFAFCDCTALADIDLPEGLKTIGRQSFAGCNRLKYVVVPDSVTAIDEFAFYGCSNLEEITIPFVGKSKTETNCLRMFGYIFGYTTSNKEGTVEQYYCHPNDSSIMHTGYYYIPSTLKKVTVTTEIEIPDNAFNNCTMLEEVTLGRATTAIGNHAFRGCTGLADIAIPASVTTIGNLAFIGCTALVDIDLPEELTTIGSYAFCECKGLTSIAIPDGATRIGVAAFSGCNQLKHVVVPNSVTWIGEAAFNECNNLEEITLPFVGRSETSTGKEGVFGYIFGYKDEANALSNPVGMVLQHIASRKEDYLPYHYYYIPDSIKKVTVTNDAEIGENAFINCKMIENIELSEVTESIGDGAFKNCGNLANMRIPDSVKSIGTSAFENCTTLKMLDIGAGITTIYSDAFLGCVALTETRISDIDAWCKISFGNKTSNPTYYSNNLWLDGEIVTAVTFPEGMSVISYYVLYNCVDITDIIIPDGITEVYPSAFQGTGYYNDASNWVDGVLYIDNYVIASNSDIPANYLIKDGTTLVANSAFAGNTKLTEIIIPDSVTHIGAGAFQNTALKTVVIGDGIKEISSAAFNGCSQISTAAYRGSESDWSKVAVGAWGNTYLTDRITYDNIWLRLYDNDGEEIKKVLTQKRTRLDESIVPEREENTYTLYADQYFGEEFDPNTIFMEDSAVYVKYTANQYTYSFLNYDGSVFYEKTADYGSVITPPSDEPFRSGTKQYTYLFVDWEDYTEGMTLTEDISFEPNFEAVTNRYTYTFYDAHGKEIKKTTADYGTVITAPAAPSKDPSAQYEYTFSGWTGYTDGMRLTGNISFTPEYSQTLRKYTYKFLDADGFEMDSKTATYGSVIILPETNPEKTKTAQYSYEFYGWEGYSDGMRLTENVTFVPEYTSTINKYTYTFTDYLGIAVKEVTANYGTEIKAPLINPEKTATAQYTYVFTGWNGFETGMTLKSDMTFTPEYRSVINNYTYTFLDGDGEVFFSEEAPYGTVIKIPSGTPEKTATQEYHYIFTEWENFMEGMTLKKDITFTSLFEEEVNCYTYTFFDGDGEVFFSEEAPYGTVIVLPSEKLNVEAPYKLDYWDGFEEGMILTEDVTFEAVLSLMEYKIVVKGYDDFSVTVTYGDSFELEVPVKDRYIFKGYYTGENGEGDLVADEDGFGLEEYLYTSDIAVYPHLVLDTENKLHIQGNEIITKGEEYTYSTVFSATEDITGIEVSLTYPESLELKEVVLKDFASVTETGRIEEDGFVTVSFEAIYSDGTECVPKEEDIVPFELIFEARTESEEEKAEIVVAGGIMKGESDVNFEAMYGIEIALTEKDYIPGDITGDGVLNRNDLLRLAKHFSGFTVEIDEAASDVTGDGKVTRNDLLRLAKYFSGFDVELGK